MTEPPSLANEFIIQLDVMMADRPGRPRPPAYSWNGGLVRHVLKNDPAMGDLKHVEVDGPGRAYLFFYDRHGYHGLPKEEALAMRFPHCRCVCRMDWEIRAFQRGFPTARNRMTMRDNRTGEAQTVG